MHEGCCSPRSAPLSMKALVPVFPLAPETPSLSSLIARSRSIKRPTSIVIVQVDHEIVDLDISVQEACLLQGVVPLSRVDCELALLIAFPQSPRTTCLWTRFKWHRCLPWSEMPRLIQTVSKEARNASRLFPMGFPNDICPCSIGHRDASFTEGRHGKTGGVVEYHRIIVSADFRPCHQDAWEVATPRERELRDVKSASQRNWLDMARDFA